MKVMYSKYFIFLEDLEDNELEIVYNDKTLEKGICLSLTDTHKSIITNVKKYFDMSNKDIKTLLNLINLQKKRG